MTPTSGAINSGSHREAGAPVVDKDPWTFILLVFLVLLCGQRSAGLETSGV